MCKVFVLKESENIGQRSPVCCKGFALLEEIIQCPLLCPPLYQHSSLLTNTTLFQDLDRDILWTKRCKKESMNNLTSQMGLEMGKKAIKLFENISAPNVYKGHNLVHVTATNHNISQVSIFFNKYYIIQSFNILSINVVSASRDSL